MAKEHMLVTWLKTRLNEGRFQRLAWVDRDAGIFTMSWMHHNSSSWQAEEFEVFLDWEKYSNRNKANKKFKPDNGKSAKLGTCSDWTACKARLRCAINKSTRVKILDKKPKDGRRTFQLLDYQSEQSNSMQQRQRQKLLQQQQKQQQQQQRERLQRLSQELADAIACGGCCSSWNDTEDGLWLSDPSSPYRHSFLLVLHHMEQRLFYRLVNFPRGAIILPADDNLTEDLGCQSQLQPIIRSQQRRSTDCQDVENVPVSVPSSLARHTQVLSNILSNLKGGIELWTTNCANSGDTVIMANRKCHTKVFVYQAVNGMYISSEDNELRYNQPESIFSANSWLQLTSSQRSSRQRGLFSPTTGSSASSSTSVRPHLLLTFGQKLRSGPHRLVLWAELLHLSTWAKTATAVSQCS